MCLLTVVPLLLSHYPSLSANTPSDLLVTNTSTLYHKSITAIHNGREAVGRAVGRAFTTSEVVETVDSTYFQAWKKGQHLWKPILLLLSSSFLSFSPISIFRKKAFHFWGSWWPRSGQILGYTPCCDWDREMQWWGLFTQILTASHTMLEVGKTWLGTWICITSWQLCFSFLQKERGRKKVLCHLRESLCHLQLGTASFACCQCAANQH